MSLKDQLFIQYAAMGLEKSLSEMVKIYIKKKGRRFNSDGITYEISLPKTKEDGISFEISSKIPEERFTGKTDLPVYFSLIKKNLAKENIQPSDIEMENITGTNKNVEKSRDYVKINCFYNTNDLYSDEEIKKQIETILNDKDSLRKVPYIPGVYTLAGRLVLLQVLEKVYENCTKTINLLRKVNTQVIKKLKMKAA